MSEKYHPEPYWSRVAKEMGKRDSGALLAGDHEPYYAYKRIKFLQLLNSISFTNKTVLEVGSGPGGNILELLKQKPKTLTGVDISSDMIQLAKKNLGENKAEFVKIDGTKIPFDDQYFDLVFSATVLQHNTDDAMMRALLTEMCRVAKEKVVLFEKVDTTVNGTDLCMARPVSYFESITQDSGFTLEEVEYINIRPSYYVSGAIRKIFNPSNYQEGDPMVKTTVALQTLTLPITKLLDGVFTSKKDLAKMVFSRR